MKLKVNSFETINTLVQLYVDKLVEERFEKEQDRDFQFLVSLEGKHSERIFLTIVSGCQHYSRQIFPVYGSSSYYGIDQLCDVIEELYNRTL